MAKGLNFHTDGARISNPSLGQQGPRTDPEQVCVLSPSLPFPFCLQVRVRLTYSRLSIFFRALSDAKLVFFPTYPGAAGHSGGDKSGAPLLTKFLDITLTLGQFTILSRDRRFRVCESLKLSSLVTVVKIFERGESRQYDRRTNMCPLKEDCWVTYIFAK